MLSRVPCCCTRIKHVLFHLYVSKSSATVNFGIMALGNIRTVMLTRGRFGFSDARGLAPPKSSPRFVGVVEEHQVQLQPTHASYDEVDVQGGQSAALHFESKSLTYKNSSFYYPWLRKIRSSRCKRKLPTMANNNTAHAPG